MLLHSFVVGADDGSTPISAGGSPILNYPAAYSQPIGAAVSPNKT